MISWLSLSRDDGDGDSKDGKDGEDGDDDDFFILFFIYCTVLYFMKIVPRSYTYKYILFNIIN